MCREQSEQRQDKKSVFILSLCGLCCSDKFRVCPDFLESLIPEIPQETASTLSTQRPWSQRAVTMTTRTWTRAHKHKRAAQMT